MRRASSIVHANACPRVLLIRPSSASQNLQSNDALCATIGCAPTKSATSRITFAAGGAAHTISLVMPVSCSMNGDTHAPAFIRLW